MDGFEAFLQQSKARLLESDDDAAVFESCIGNEAADADSIVSALSYSFIRHAQQCASGQPLPVVSVARRDFQSRAETNALLNAAQLSPDTLICVDEAPLGHLAERGRLRLVLLDHNVLCEAQQPLEPAVFHILDHHKDMGRYPAVSGELRNIAYDDAANGGIGMAEVGSTCSLVVEAAAAMDAGVLSKKVALLLYGVILLDTANMSPRAGKGTPRDEQALRVLEGLFADCEGAAAADGVEWPTRDALFRTIQAAKFDQALWNDLPTTDAIKYDYKQFVSDAKGKRLGVASILTNLDSFLSNKAAFVEDAQAFIDDNHLDLLALMFSWLPDGLDGELHRQILLMGSAETASAVAGLVTAEGQNQFQMVPIDLNRFELEAPGGLKSDPDSKILAFTQELRKASRKQVAPALLAALDH